MAKAIDLCGTSRSVSTSWLCRACAWHCQRSRHFWAAIELCAAFRSLSTS